MMNPRRYYRIMLGRSSKHAQECHQGNFIGVDFGIHTNLTDHLPENWQDFNKEFIPIYLKDRPEKTKIAAGLACGALWVVSKGIKIGDIILSPTGSGSYLVGEVTGAYEYHPDQILPHRRAVQWYPQTIARADMSAELQSSTGVPGTTSNIDRYAAEIEQLMAGNAPATLIATDNTIEDPVTFALEKHLEEFLVQNWKQTLLGQKYDIFEEDGELVGQQYPTDTGPIDILAISKDKQELLVVELKRGRASDRVVGQIQRYMGYVVEELAEAGQTVKGVIIALEDDLPIQRALKVAPNIEFYRYKVSFELYK
ncbi:MAG: DUF91 domain-containing protein [Anaerolineae bacterium]|nr:DUF91 domain-containing protein [Anaerolineae bacterium]